MEREKTAARRRERGAGQEASAIPWYAGPCPAVVTGMGIWPSVKRSKHCRIPLEET